MSQPEDELDPAEHLIRRVPKRVDYFDPSLALPITPFVFRPNKERDGDGLSFYRECMVSPAKLANSARKPAENYVVVRLKVEDLLALGLSVRPAPGAGDLPGHVVVPELSSVASRDASKREWAKEINFKLAELAGKDVLTDFDRDS